MSMMPASRHNSIDAETGAPQRVKPIAHLEPANTRDCAIWISRAVFRKGCYVERVADRLTAAFSNLVAKDTDRGFMMARDAGDCRLVPQFI